MSEHSTCWARDEPRVVRVSHVRNPLAVAMGRFKITEKYFNEIDKEVKKLIAEKDGRVELEAYFASSLLVYKASLVSILWKYLLFGRSLIKHYVGTEGMEKEILRDSSCFKNTIIHNTKEILEEFDFEKMYSATITTRKDDK